MINNIDSKIKTLWDNRSNKYKDNILGVLPKSFPLSVNKYIDNWEFKLATKQIINVDGFKVLDIGCGYGRISERLLKKFGNIKLYGVDIAQKYVDIYNENLKPHGTAINADMRKLPYKNENFNFVLIVTSLMYITNKKDQKKAIAEVFRVLKKRGKLLIIERDVSSYNLITLWGLIPKIRGAKNNEINAVGYEPKYLFKLIGKSGVVENKIGIPFMTILLPIFFVVNLFKWNIFSNFLIKIVDNLDSTFDKIIYPSLYTAYVISKK